MTMDRCIRDLQASGQLDKERAEKAQATYDDLVRSYIEAGMDQKLAELKASMASLDALKMAAAEKKRQALLQINAQSSILGKMQASDDWGRIATALFDHDERVPGVSNIAARHRAIRGRAHARMTEVLATFKRDILGRVNAPTRLDNLVREAFGEATDDPSARELMVAWKDTAEWLRQKFNAAGGMIGKRDDWGMPQMHDMLAVRRAGYEAWRDTISPLLDRTKMLAEDTGLPMSAQAFEVALRQVYDTISSDGWNKITPRGAGGGRKLANRRADHRFLVFKDAEGWLAYQKQFGHGTPFDVMMGHIDGVSRDIAQMEILGPNPGATRKWLEQIVTKNAVERDIAEGTEKWSARAQRTRFAMEAMHGQFTGAINTPVNVTLARFMGGWRGMETAAKLGSATLSAVTDVGFSWVTSRFTGVPYWGVISQQLKLLNPASNSDRKLAVRLGLIAEEWSSVAAAQQRYVDTVNVPEVINRLADGVLRASGLSAWTQAGRWAFGMEFLGTLGDAVGRPYDRLNRGLRMTLDRYGISADDWNVIRATPLYESKGATFLRPDDIAARTDIDAKQADALATKLLEAVTTESVFAVPEATLQARALLNANLRAGTVPGEFVRSAMQFKAFPVSILYTHIRRALYGKGHLSRAQYTANLIIATTVMGALALQLKQIAAGKDPRPMGDEKFIAAAMAQGGGAGLLGDFFFSDYNRFGGGLAESLAGPATSTATKIGKFTMGNAAEIIEGEDTQAGREAIDLVKSAAPGSSLWYTKLAFNRLLLDQIQKEVDPDYRAAFRRMERRAKKEFDQAYWWGPGDDEPERLPELESVFE